MKISAANQTAPRHHNGGKLVSSPPEHFGKNSCKKFSRSEKAAALKGMKMKAAAQLSAANGQLPPGSPALGLHGLRTVRRPLSANRSNQKQINMNNTNQNAVADENPRVPVSKDDYPANAEELYRENLPQVISWARSKGARDPETFSHDTLDRALRGFDCGLSTFGQRLNQMMVWNLMDEFRYRYNREPKALPLMEELFELPGEDEHSPAELQEEVSAGLDQLQPLDRELLRERFWNGRSITEIIALPQYAQRGMKPHQVKASYGRALACLQRRLSSPFGTCTQSALGAVRRSCQNPKPGRTPSTRIPPARKKNSRPTCVPSQM